VTRGTLVTSCSEELRLDTTASTAELAAIQRWANEAVLDFLVRTRVRVTLGDLVLTPTVGDYRLDANILALTEAYIPGSTDKLLIVGLDDIIELRRVNASLPQGFGTQRMGIEGSLAMVWPTPTAADTIRYVFVPKPTAMSADANDPAVDTYGGVPEEYHEGLLLYMNWKGSRYDGAAAPHSPKEYWDLYREYCVSTRKAHRMKSGERGKLVMAKVGYPDRMSVPRRNDTA
jgi:hypothetical protein